MVAIGSDKPEGSKAFLRKYSKELTIALALAIVAAIGIEVWKSWTKHRAIENNLNAVATLIAYDRNGNLAGQGSGFFVNPTGMLVTNAHVVRGMGSVHAKLKSGAYYELQSIRSINSDVDIAILQFSASETPSISGLGNSDDIRIGDKVFTIGTPTGQENTYSEGNISFTKRELNGRKFLQFTAPISPGSSGGGLFDEDGNIIGITTASLHSTSGAQAGFEQNLNYAVPINDLSSLLNGNRAQGKSATDYYFQGNLAENARDWDGAVRYYSRAVELDTLYTSAYTGLASAYFELGNYELEVENYQAAVRTDPDNSDSWYYLAVAYEDVQKYDEAFNAFLKSHKLNPENKEMLHDFSLLCIAIGRKDAASSLIGDLTRLNPGWGRVLRSILNKVPD